MRSETTCVKYNCITEKIVVDFQRQSFVLTAVYIEKIKKVSQFGKLAHTGIEFYKNAENSDFHTCRTEWSGLYL